MNNFDDERILFYLNHRKLIDQWTEIRSEVPSRTHKFLFELEDDIQELGEMLGADIKLYKEESGYPKLSLHRNTWPIGDNKPAVGIGIEWGGKSVDLQDRPPYVGVWTNRHTLTGIALSEMLNQSLNSVALRYGMQQSKWFPVKLHIHCEYEQFWLHLDDYRQHVLSEIELMWKRCVDEVDIAVQSLEEPVA